MKDKPSTRPQVSLIIFAFSSISIISAFLLFIVEPLCGKALLPAFGGGPALWNSCVVFFQLALLLGYLGAHLLGKLARIRTQVILYAGLLSLGVAFLPFNFDAGDPSQSQYPALIVLGTLFTGVGFPILLLCAAAPTLQNWLARGFNVDPYPLYAASNAGSLLGLLSYPFLIEWTIGLHTQALVWKVAYGVLIIFIALIGYLSSRSESASIQRKTPTSFELPKLRQLTIWISLSMIPSALLVAVTGYITTDIAPVPLFWVLPLVLYLATFIIAFRKTGFTVPRYIERAFILLAIGLQIIIAIEATQPALLLMAVHLAALFLGSLLCHSELSRARPEVTLLTTYYLAISIGGLLGGIFSTLIVPTIFSKPIEYPFLLAVVPVAYAALHQTRLAIRALFPAIFTVFAITAGIAFCVLPLIATSAKDSSLLPTAFTIPALVTLFFSSDSWRAGWSILALFVGALFYSSTHGSEVFRQRSFYGTVRVSMPNGLDEMALVHGHVIHGRQRLSERERCVPLSYYHRRGPAGEVFLKLGDSVENRHIALVGLGSGALACYARSNELWQFYELDPNVDTIARNEKFFTFLRNAAAPIQTVIGDARLKLASVPPHSLDVLVLDAFSSDSVPVHLLTEEAFLLYREKLTAHGLLLIHISNQFLDLVPVLASVASLQGWIGRINNDLIFDPTEPAKDASTWVILSQHQDVIERLGLSKNWAVLPAGDAAAAWSDDYSNIVKVLRLAF